VSYYERLMSFYSVDRLHGRTQTRRIVHTDLGGVVAAAVVGDVVGGTTTGTSSCICGL
jgi:hypothetical protein